MGQDTKKFLLYVKNHILDIFPAATCDRAPRLRGTSRFSSTGIGRRCESRLPVCLIWPIPAESCGKARGYKKGHSNWNTEILEAQMWWIIHRLRTGLGTLSRNFPESLSASALAWKSAISRFELVHCSSAKRFCIVSNAVSLMGRAFASLCFVPAPKISQIQVRNITSSEKQILMDSGNCLMTPHTK